MRVELCPGMHACAPAKALLMVVCRGPRILKISYRSLVFLPLPVRHACLLLTDPHMHP